MLPRFAGQLIVRTDARLCRTPWTVDSALCEPDLRLKGGGAMGRLSPDTEQRVWGVFIHPYI